MYFSLHFRPKLHLNPNEDIIIFPLSPETEERLQQPSQITKPILAPITQSIFKHTSDHYLVQRNVKPQETEVNSSSNNLEQQKRKNKRTNKKDNKSKKKNDENVQNCEEIDEDDEKPVKKVKTVSINAKVNPYTILFC